MRTNGHYRPRQETLLSQWLKDAGYATGIVGHFHHKQEGGRGFDSLSSNGR